MRRLFHIVVALVLGVSLSAQPRRDQSVITVYVGPVLNADGFTDAEPGIGDSIKDIQVAVAARRGWRLVPSETGADVALHLLHRSVEVQDDGDALLPVGNAIFHPRTHTDYRVLEVELVAGTVHRALRTPQAGDHYTNWKGAAGRIVTQAAAWVTANREAILAQRP